MEVENSVSITGYEKWLTSGTGSYLIGGLSKGKCDGYENRGLRCRVLRYVWWKIYFIYFLFGWKKVYRVHAIKVHWLSRRDNGDLTVSDKLKWSLSCFLTINMAVSAVLFNDLDEVHNFQKKSITNKERKKDAKMDVLYCLYYRHPGLLKDTLD